MSMVSTDKYTKYFVEKTKICITYRVNKLFIFSKNDKLESAPDRSPSFLKKMVVISELDQIYHLILCTIFWDE